MLDLTRQERGFFLFLLVFFVLGLGVSLYKTHFMDQRALTPDQRASQEEFLGQIRNRSKVTDSVSLRSGNSQWVAAAPASHLSTESDHPSDADKVFTGKIDLNQAAIEDLTRLPRVGPVLARRIIEWRQENGPFKRIEDLKKVRGIGQKTFEKISPYVIVKPN